MKRLLLIVIIIVVLVLTYGVLNAPPGARKTAEITREATWSGQAHLVR